MHTLSVVTLLTVMIVILQQLVLCSEQVKNISRSNALLIEIIIEVLWDTCRCAKNKVEVL